MKSFLAVFTGSLTSLQQTRWAALDEATRKARIGAGMKAWQDWQSAHADVIVDHGGPLGKTKRVSEAGADDIRNNLSGYVILRAHSQEDAAALFKNHPHYTIFPGDGVEIMEIMPIPGQT